MSKNIEIAKNILINCMAVQKNEKLLILTDNGKLDLAHAFADAGRELGFDTVLIEGTAQEGGEPQSLLASALLEADVTMMLTSGSFTHTRARSIANDKGTRIASMPRITEEVITETLDVDFREMIHITEILSKKLDNTKEIHLTTKLGTDLYLYTEGRPGIADSGKLVTPGICGNLPAGEAEISPLEDKGDGVLVIDGVIAGIGIMDEPLRMVIKDGAVVELSGKHAADYDNYTANFDANARKICEFGIGTNPSCKISGNPLCDEKVYGTVHLGFGNNMFMMGKQDSNVHYDCIIKEPTVYLDGECIIKDGEHIYDIDPMSSLSS